MDKQACAAAMARLGAAYSRKVEDDQLVVFYNALCRYSNDSVLKATAQWIESQERFPTPTQLIATTQAVLRRWAHERSDSHGIAEQSDESGQQQLDPDSLKKRQLAGVQAARTALAAARAKQPEQGDTE